MIKYQNTKFMILQLMANTFIPAEQISIIWIDKTRTKMHLTTIKLYLTVY